MAVHVRYNSLYISLPSSAKQQREMMNSACVGFCRGSRVEGKISRVEGRGSRVEGRGSRVNQSVNPILHCNDL